MIPVNPVVDEIAARLDPGSAEWLRVLAGTGPQQETALARLHEMLVRIAQRETRRRGPRMLIAGPELEDLAYQAAADALMAITGKLSQFHGRAGYDMGLQVRHPRGVG
jgi:RNA polymerase sigma-70 factor, ECF subfamily